MLNVYTIKRFINGEIDEEDFNEVVNGTFETLYQKAKEYGSNGKDGAMNVKVRAKDYIKSALKDWKAINLIENEEEGEAKMLPKQAAICDMCNNLAHASDLIRDNNYKRTASLFSLKTNMINQIAKECERQGNECYGKTTDTKKNSETFIVDIPMYGQVAWHLGKKKIDCKEYDFEKDITDYRNCDFLSRSITSSNIKDLPAHTRKVMEAMDNEEMAESLYGGQSPTKVKNSDAPII